MTTEADASFNALEVIKKQNAEIGGEEIHEKAHHMRGHVLPAMLEVRGAADTLEEVVSRSYWLPPGYRDAICEVNAPDQH